MDAKMTENLPKTTHWLCARQFPILTVPRLTLSLCGFFLHVLDWRSQAVAGSAKKVDSAVCYHDV